MTYQITRPAWAEIDTSKIASNVKYISSILPKNTDILGVVKANGYGHGAVESGKIALENGVRYLGVAMLDEGLELRRAGIDAPILIMGHIFQKHVKSVVENDMTTIVASIDLAKELSKTAVTLGKKAKIHIKMDTGMNRIGIFPSGAKEFVCEVAKLPSLEIEGICSHLGTADCDKDFARSQIALFLDTVNEIEKCGIHIPIRHIANTAAAISIKESALDMVRVGIAMYGMSYTQNPEDTKELLPALELKTSVEYLKHIDKGDAIGYGASYVAKGRELIATLPIGYADGYSRGLSTDGEVLIGGTRCAIVGRICMDQMMVKIPNSTDICIGQEVVLIGKQGTEEIRVEELSHKLDTINYEITCNINPRVQRVYI